MSVATPSDLPLVAEDLSSNETDIPESVLRYLCESTDSVLNLTTVEFFANISVNETSWPELDWQAAIRILFIGLLFVFSVVGNTIVVLVVFWSPNLKSSLNFYLVNLAIADLLITCVCIWNHLVKNIFYNYPLGPFMCKIGSFVQASCLLGSVLTLSTLSLERVYAVLCPLRARRGHHPPSVTLACVWIVSVLASAPLCALNEYREYQFPKFKERRCTYYHSPGTFNDTDGKCLRDTHTFIFFYHVLVTVMMFFLPLLVMFCAYTLIVQRLWVLESLGESPESATTAHLSAKKKVVRLSCSVLLCFVACWAPLQTTILYAMTAKPEALSSPEFESTIFWVYMLAYSNSALNPLLYAWFSKIFREEFKAMISSRERRYSTSFVCRSSARLEPLTRVPLQPMHSFHGSCRDARVCSSYCGNNSAIFRYEKTSRFVGKAESYPTIGRLGSEKNVDNLMSSAALTPTSHSESVKVSKTLGNIVDSPTELSQSVPRTEAEENSSLAERIFINNCSSGRDSLTDITVVGGLTPLSLSPVISTRAFEKIGNGLRINNRVAVTASEVDRHFITDSDSVNTNGKEGHTRLFGGLTTKERRIQPREYQQIDNKTITSIQSQLDEALSHKSDDMPFSHPIKTFIPINAENIITVENSIRDDERVREEDSVNAHKNIDVETCITELSINVNH